MLAGNRAGRPDPLALRAGVSHKAVLPVAGTPMVLRVIDALRACPGIGQVVVSADALPNALLGAGVLMRPEAASPSRSVAAVFEEFGAPLLVTTADHALLSREVVEHFLLAASTGTDAGADAVAAVARSGVVLAAYPGSRRTWLRFRDGAFTGCNLFLLRTPHAARAVRFWQTVEQQRKSPLAMARLIGPAALLGYLLRLLTLRGALRVLGRRVGVRLAVAELPFADAAIDVDKADDLALVEAVLAGRGAGPSAGPSR